MDQTNGTPKGSLLSRQVFAVCFPQRESARLLHDELARARRSFFTEGRTARPAKAELEGRLRGKLGRGGFYWKKTLGGVAAEESFQRPEGYVLVRRDLRSAVVSRVYYDRGLRWTKSEYFRPGEPDVPATAFAPDPDSDLIRRLDLQEESGRYRVTELHALPYYPGTAEQSLLNARFGEPILIVSAADGEFCYCPKKEAQERLSALEEIREGTIVMMPAWEVREGALPGEPDEDEEETALFEEVDAVEEPEEEPAEEPLEESAGDSAPPEEERVPEELEKIAEEILGGASQSGDGEREEDFSLTAAPAPIREGFHPRFDKNGSLSYAGSWKNDQKDGIGVSFRSTDHALHISRWEAGKPGEYVTLFDKDGGLRYSGRMVNNKKEGAGISVDPDDGSVFVGKWENGEPTGFGSSFDRDGNLLYYGGWKDGKPDGHGTQFDQNGSIIFDGEWKDGKYHNGILYQKHFDTDVSGEEEP